MQFKNIAAIALFAGLAAAQDYGKFSSDLVGFVSSLILAPSNSGVLAALETDPALLASLENITPTGTDFGAIISAYPTQIQPFLSEFLIGEQAIATSDGITLGATPPSAAASLLSSAAATAFPTTTAATGTPSPSSLSGSALSSALSTLSTASTAAASSSASTAATSGGSSNSASVAATGTSTAGAAGPTGIALGLFVGAIAGAAALL